MIGEIDVSLDIEDDGASMAGCRGTVTRDRMLYRSATSERALEDCIDWHLEPGCSYHVISSGEIDMLSFLKLVVRQQRVERLHLVTFCISMNGAREVFRMVERGAIGEVNWYLGNIVPRTRKSVMTAIRSFCKEHGGRVSVLRNHSKVLAIKGERFDCVTESSANFNSNPEIEQTVVTVDDGLYRFYADYYDSIGAGKPCL